MDDKVSSLGRVRVKFCFKKQFDVTLEETCCVQVVLK